MDPKDHPHALSESFVDAGIWSRAFTWLAPVMLVIVALLPYAQVGEFSFVNYDDPLHVGLQSEVLSGLNGNSVKWALGATPSNLWHPLTWMSYMAEVSFFGGGVESPSVHHRGNLLQHLSCVLIVYAIMRTLALSPLLAMLMAMLYALHPLHAEPVSWISARKDVLSGVFSLSAIWMYLLHQKCGSGDRGSWKKRGMALLVFALLILALCSKPSSVVVPLLMVVAYGFLERDENLPANPVPVFAHKMLSLWPYLLLAVVVAGVAVGLQHSGTHGQTVLQQSAFERLAYLPALLGFYGWRIIFPWGLTFDYPLPSGSSLVVFYGFGLLMVAGVFLAWRWRRSLPGLALGGLWFFVCLLPVMGFVYVGTSFSSDRYVYLALIGPVIALARIIESRRRREKAVWMTVAVVLIGLSALLTQKQVAVWKSDETLFGHAVAFQPASLTAQTNMASYYRTVGDKRLAMDHYQLALKIAPYDHIVNYNIADIHYRNGEWQKAKDAALRVVESVPRFHRAHYLLGNISSDPSKPLTYDAGQAFEHFELAYRIAPSKPKYAYAYARQLAIRKRNGQALEILERGASYLPPGSPWKARFQSGIEALSR